MRAASAPVRGRLDPPPRIRAAGDLPDETHVLRRLLLTTSTVLWLWGAYSLYSATVTPTLQPSPEALRAVATAAGEEAGQPVSEADVSLARKYLRDAPWIDPPKDAPDELQLFQIHIGDHLQIFARSIDQQRGSPEVKFTPFAMLIVPQQGKDGTRPEPVTIVADSASIRFQNPLEFRGSPGRIVSGRFNGKVTLRGPDNLSLFGDNFIFEERIDSPSSLLYSDSRVNFTYGPHSGQGRYINVEFTRLNGPLPNDLPAISGIDKVWMNRDVHLELVDDRQSKAELPQGHSRPRRPETLIVDAQGRLTFDLRQSRVTLEDQVRLRHPVLDGTQDSVLCELLVLELLKPEASQPAVQASPDGDDDHRFANWLPKRFELAGFTATGNPTNAVHLSSEQHALWADMRSLQYDLRNRKITLLEEQNEGVHIVQGPYTIDNHEIHITHGPDYELLNVECLRPGRIISKGDQRQPFQASWQERMSKHPSPDVPGEEIVELHGKAHLVQPLERMSLTADHLFAGFILSKGTPKPALTTRKPRSPTGTANIEPENLQIRWVNAQDNVRLMHPKVVGNTHRLALTFEESPNPLPVRSTLAAKSSPVVKPASFKKTAPEKTPPASETTSEAPPTDPPLSETEKSAPLFTSDDPPPELTAGELQVKILRHGKQQHVSEIKGLNRFELQQQHRDGSAPLHVLGDWVQLFNRSETDQEIVLHGQPALLKDRGNSLAGPQIRVDRRKNTADVIGPGQLTGPVGSSLDGKPLKEPQQLSVRWLEKAHFDGRQITFYQRVHCELQDSSMTCPEMSVELSEPVSFAQLASNPKSKSVPDIKGLECKHQVVFEQNSYLGDQHNFRAVGDVTHFKVDRKSGKTVASGPGTFRVWRRKTSGAKSGGPQALVQTSHRDSSGADRRVWEYQEIRFRNQMQGNFTQRFTVFEGPVQVIYGPVSLPTEMVPLEKIPPDGGTMDCDELHVTQEPDAESAGQAGDKEQKNFNLLGKGSVRLDGFGFYARADEINHDQSKSQYKLRAHGKGAVDLWYRDLDSGQDKHAAGESFDFRVVNGAVKELKGHRISVIDGSD